MAVYVIYDALGSMGSDRAMFQRMAAAGVRLAAFHPVAPWACRYSWRPWNRDHRKLLLIDEPSEGLAPMIVESIYAIIAELKQAGCTILLVEQNVAVALKVCDRFVAIERGRIVVAGTAHSAEDCERLMAAIAV